MKRKGETDGDLSGFLDRDTVLKGDIQFKDTLRIDGKFEGTIRSGRTLVVGEAADVNADIEVMSLYVGGRLRGSARVGERTELSATARVQSDLVTTILVVEEGAVFEGHCSMAKEKTSGLREVEDSGQRAKKFISST